MVPIALFVAVILLGEPPFASVAKLTMSEEVPGDLCRIRLSKTIDVEDGTLRCVAISPDRKLIACCGDRFVHLFDLESGERLQRLDGHKGAVNTVAFSPDNKLLASAGDDQTIQLWEVETWKLKGFLTKTIAHDRAPTTCLAFSPDAKTLASCTSLRQYDVWLWDVEKMLWEHYVRTTHREGCLHLTFSPDGKHVAIAGAKNRAVRSGQVSLHKVNVGLQFFSSWAHEGDQPATCVAFSPDGSTVASAGSDNTVRLWDVKAGRERLKIAGPKGAKGIRAVSFLQGGLRIVTVSFEESVQLWDAAKGTLLATATGTDKAVRSMALSSNGNLVATCGEDKVVKLWELSLPSSVTGPLRRRAMFGAQLAPVTKEVRERQKLDGDGGIVIERVFPGTSAADADFKIGDVILAVGGAKLTGIPMFLENVAKSRAEDVVVFDVVRDGVKTEKSVTLKEMPREKGEGFDVVYGSVTNHGARLRTIVTRPKAAGRHPSVLLLQGGHTCFSLDNPIGRPTGITWIAHDLARHGYVTMRVERPGCGDSEGGPLRDVDFDSELDGLRQALRALKQFDFVDADNVFLFGHSQGGIAAPLMAVEQPVRGIAVYGTVSESGLDGILGQRRRLARLDGTKPAEVNREILDQARFWYPLLVERKTPREIREHHRDLPNRVWEQWVTEEKYVYDRHYRFYHQGVEKNLPEAWSNVAATRLLVRDKVASPRVLAVWGKSDWAVDRASNVWIAEIVNRTKPGQGTFIALEGIDHFFFRAATPEESYKIWKPAHGAPAGEFNPIILETLRRWLDETMGRIRKETT